MHQTKLRAVGGSIMLAIPKPVLALANLKAGAAVGIEIEGGMHRFKARQPRPRRVSRRASPCAMPNQ